MIYVHIVETTFTVRHIQTLGEIFSHLYFAWRIWVLGRSVPLVTIIVFVSISSLRVLPAVIETTTFNLADVVSTDEL